MKILAIEHELPNAAPEVFQGHAQEEARKAWELHKAVLVLECDSSEEANQILGELPFVREGLITFELIPLKAYPGFGRLFREGDS